jgi:hypothetical protein
MSQIPQEDRKAPRKTFAVAAVALIGFAAVLAAIEYNAYRGQVAFGQHYLHLNGWPLATTYAALQGGTLATAALSLWSVIARDSYGTHRLWTAIFLGAAVLADYLGASAAGWPTVGALYVAGFSIAALRTWHAILRRIKRDASPRYPALRFPLLRWLMAPGETRRAFRLSYLDSLSPAEALTRVRGELPPPAELLTEDGTDVRRLTKSQAIEAAYAAIGSYDVAAAMRWLAERGVTANRSSFYDVRDKLAAARQAALMPVTTKALPAKPAAPAKKSPAKKTTAKPAAAEPPAEQKAS